MSIKSLLEQLDDFFDLSKKKQRKKRQKLDKLIQSLEEKKAKLKREMRREAHKDRNSKKAYNLCKEFKVISRMIKKAKKRAQLISHENCC